MIVLRKNIYLDSYKILLANKQQSEHPQMRTAFVRSASASEDASLLSKIEFANRIAITAG
jgi:hypothetical protein